MAILGQKFDFWGQIAEKQEFSQIQANIPLISHKKYYNWGGVKKIVRLDFFKNYKAYFPKNDQKFTKSGPRAEWKRQ